MGRILIKLGENVGTSVWLILLKFHCATPLELCATRKAHNGSKGLMFLHFYMRFRAFPVDWDNFFFENFREREAQISQEQSEKDASANMLRQTVTLATAIFLYWPACLFVCLCADVIVFRSLRDTQITWTVFSLTNFELPQLLTITRSDFGISTLATNLLRLEMDRDK